MTRLLLAILLCLACAASSAAQKEYGADDAAQDVWLLENGARETWLPALRRLMAERYLSKRAVASVLRRMEVLEGRDRVALCKALGTALSDPRAQQALLGLARDSEEAVRNAARAALAGHAGELAPETLLALADEAGEERVRFLRAWTTRYGEVEGVKASRRDAARIAAAGPRRDDSAFAALSRLSLDADERVARQAIEALGLLIDTRVEERLFELGQAGNVTALWQLAYRGDARAFEPLVRWTGEEAGRARSDWDRRKAFERTGNDLPALFFPRLATLYRAAGDAARKQGARLMIEGHLGLGLLDEPGAMRELNALAGDPDEFLRGSANKVLEWERNRAAERAAPRLMGRALLVGAGLAGIAVGLVIYLLAFRLLMLKRFVRSLPVQKIRSVPTGLVALQGEVRPHRDQYTAHPFTGERCVIFEQIRMPFWLDDGTGRILVDPKGAALLSEDGVVVPGERVLVVGTFKKAAPAQADGAATDDGGEPEARPSLARRDQELTWFSRAGGWLVRALTRATLGQTAARMMFLDARQCFWIWDNLDERPFLAQREAAAMTAGVMFTGAWLLVIVGAILGLPSL